MFTTGFHTVVFVRSYSLSRILKLQPKSRGARDIPDTFVREITRTQKGEFRRGNWNTTKEIVIAPITNSTLLFYLLTASVIAVQPMAAKICEAETRNLRSVPSSNMSTCTRAQPLRLMQMKPYCFGHYGRWALIDSLLSTEQFNTMMSYLGNQCAHRAQHLVNRNCGSDETGIANIRPHHRSWVFKDTPKLLKLYSLDIDAK